VSTIPAEDRTAPKPHSLNEIFAATMGVERLAKQALGGKQRERDPLVADLLQMLGLGQEERPARCRTKAHLFNARTRRVGSDGIERCLYCGAPCKPEVVEIDGTIGVAFTADPATAQELLRARGVRVPLADLVLEHWRTNRGKRYRSKPGLHGSYPVMIPRLGDR
jgi:hypothetical protein